MYFFFDGKGKTIPVIVFIDVGYLWFCFVVLLLQMVIWLFLAYYCSFAFDNTGAMLADQRKNCAMRQV